MQARSAAASVARVRAIKGAIISAAVVAALVLAPSATLAAKGGNGNGGHGPQAGTASSTPSLAASCAGACAVGAPLTVSGTGLIPSSGGQMVILWVGYPNDYCSADLTVCHGFYVNPWVDDNGTFSMTFTNVTMQAGTGTVSATQYSSQNDKWSTVASASYTVG